MPLQTMALQVINLLLTLSPSHYFLITKSLLFGPDNDKIMLLKVVRFKSDFFWENGSFMICKHPAKLTPPYFLECIGGHTDIQLDD